MTVDSAIDFFRLRQAEQFTTTATVTRRNVDIADPDATDPYSGAVDLDGETVYEGGCKIRPAETVGSSTQAGDRSSRLTGFLGRFPVDSDLRIGDSVTVTASEHDAGLIGKTLTVTDVLWDEWQISRNVTLELGPGVEQVEGGS